MGSKNLLDKGEPLLIVIRGDHLIIVKIDRVGIQNEEDQEIFKEILEEDFTWNEFLIC
jgi:hypothetical protein